MNFGVSILLVDCKQSSQDEATNKTKKTRWTHFVVYVGVIAYDVYYSVSVRVISIFVG